DHLIVFIIPKRGEKKMGKRLILILLTFSIFFLSGCAYWPKTLTPKYFHEGFKDVKNDIDDGFGARSYDD
ncbi:hypothetical protein ACFLQ1_02625, partial [Candidatus Auribacterota bacterium]